MIILNLVRGDGVCGEVTVFEPQTKLSWALFTGKFNTVYRFRNLFKLFVYTRLTLCLIRTDLSLESISTFLEWFSERRRSILSKNESRILKVVELAVENLRDIFILAGAKISSLPQNNSVLCNWEVMTVGSIKVII